MRGKTLFIVLTLLATTTLASAANGRPSSFAEPFSLTGTANGASPPVVLQASTMYAFAFDVFNTGGGTEAIKQLDITLPNASYAVEEATLRAPTALHPDRGAWTVTYATDTATLTWLFQGTVSSAELGDIDQGQDLVSPFRATTDAAATDGFAWTLTGDAGTVVGPDVFYFNSSYNDDDIGPDDDDDSSPCAHPCTSESQCQALGSGWICVDDCCVQQPADDDNADDDASPGGDDDNDDVSPSHHGSSNGGANTG